MGRTSPIVLRSGHLFNNWKSHWFSDSNYTNLLTEDLKIRYYINNVHYYLKLPSSDLSIRRPQNRVGVMYHSIYIPEYQRVEKIMPYKFNFFRFTFGEFELFTNTILSNSWNNKKRTSFNLLFNSHINRIVTKTPYDLLVIKNYIWYYMLKQSGILNFDHNFKVFYSDLVTFYSIVLIGYKSTYNLYYKHAVFLNHLKFKKTISNKYFNKKFNLTSLFKLVSAEDILMNNFDKPTKAVIRQVRRNSYTARSIMLLDSFGKFYRYLPQRSRRKFPFYDFIYFYKINFINLLKLYSNYFLFKKKKRKRKLSGKRLRKKYFVKFIVMIRNKIYKLKLLLAYLIKLNNNTILLSKKITVTVKSMLNKYFLESQIIPTIYGKQIRPSSYYTNILYACYFNKKFNRFKKRESFLFDKVTYKKPPFYKKSVQRLINKIKQTRYNWDYRLDIVHKDIKVSKRLSKVLKNLSLDYNSLEILQNLPRSNYNLLITFKHLALNLMTFKRRSLELLDYQWTSLKKNYKLITSKFRNKKMKVYKSKYYKSFRKKQYIPSYMNNKWIIDQTFHNLEIQSPSENYLHKFHPTYQWIKGLVSVPDAYWNKLTNYNRFYFNNRALLNNLGKTSFYYTRLRKRKRRTIDKFDIRYIPKGWHRNIQQRSSYRKPTISISSRKLKRYLNMIRKRYDKDVTLNTLKRRLGLSVKMSAILVKRNLLKQNILPARVKNRIKNKTVLRIIVRYIQRLIKIKRKSNKKLIKLINKLRSKSRRRFKAKERKLKHLDYIRLFSRTLKRRYSTLYTLTLRLTRYYLIKRFKRATRNPDRFYKFKKSKLPIPTTLKKFKQRVYSYSKKKHSKFHRNKRNYQQQYYQNDKYRINRYKHHKDFQLLRTRRLKKQNHKTDLKLIHYKKYLSKHLYTTLNYNLTNFKNKLINLLILNKDCRLLILQKNTLILRKYFDILNSKSIKHIRHHIYNLKRNKFKIKNISSRYKRKYKEITNLKNRPKIQSHSNLHNYFIRINKSTTVKPFIEFKYISRGLYDLFGSELSDQIKQLTKGKGVFRIIQHGNKIKLLKKQKPKVVTTFKLFNHLHKYLVHLNDYPTIQQILTSLINREYPLKKTHQLYLLLCILNTVIQTNLVEYKNLYKNITSTTENKKDHLTLSSVLTKNKKQTKLLRSYYNFKIRTRMKVFRARYHYKSLLKFVVLNKNKLFYNLSFLKKLVGRISNHLKYLFMSLHQNQQNRLNKMNTLNDVATSYSMYSSNKNTSFKLKKLNHNYMIPTGIRRHLVARSKYNKLKFKHNYNKIMKFVAKYLKTNKLPVESRIMFKSILTSTHYNIDQILMSKKTDLNSNSNKVIKGTLNSLFSIFVQNFIYNNYYFNKKKHNYYSENYTPRKYRILNPIHSPMSTNLIKLKRYIKNIKNKPNIQYSNTIHDKLTNYNIVTNSELYNYEYTILTIVRYFNIIGKLYSKLINTFYNKYRYFNKTLNLTSKKNLNLYQSNFQYMFKNQYFIINCMKTLSDSVLNYLNSNLFYNLVTYLKNNILINVFGIEQDRVLSAKNTYKSYSYFNIKSKVSNIALKKMYGNNLINTKYLLNSNLNISQNHNTIIEKNLYNESLNTLHNIGSYMSEDGLGYIQLNYVMEYDTNQLVSSKENFLYFYNLYSYNYDYNCMFILNPRLLCDYFVYAIKNKVQYYEIFGDIKEAFSDLRRLQIAMKKIYDKILYKFLHSYIDIMTDWYYLKVKSKDDNIIMMEYKLFLKKLKVITTLFNYLVYLVGIRNYINICGLHIKSGGRRSRKLRTHTRLYNRGKMSLNTFSDDIDYYFKPVMSRFGTLGLKVFIYREPCYRIPLLQIMYETLFLRFKLLRSLLTENLDNDPKR